MRKNVLKKSAVAALAVILCVLSVFVCSAADNSYVISEINDMKISLPDNITTVTRSSKADDKYFSVFGLDYDTTMKNLENGNIYLQGMNSNSEITITVTMTQSEESKRIGNYNLLQEDKLSDVTKNFLSQSEYTACSPDSAGSIVWMYLAANVNSNGSQIKTYQANTVFDGKNVNVVIQRNGDDVKPEDYATLNSIVSTVVFQKADSSSNIILFVIIGATLLIILIIVFLILIAKFARRKRKKRKNSKIIEELSGKYTRKNTSQDDYPSYNIADFEESDEPKYDGDNKHSNDDDVVDINPEVHTSASNDDEDFDDYFYGLGLSRNSDKQETKRESENTESYEDEIDDILNYRASVNKKSQAVKIYEAKPETEAEENTAANVTDNNTDSNIEEVEPESVTEVSVDEINVEPSPEEEMIDVEAVDEDTDSTDENTDDSSDDSTEGNDNDDSEEKPQSEQQSDSSDDADSDDDFNEYTNDEDLVRQDARRAKFNNGYDFFEEAPKKTMGVVSSKEIRDAEDYDVINEVEKRAAAVEKAGVNAGKSVLNTFKAIGSGIKSFGTHCGYFATNVSRMIKHKRAAKKRRQAEEERRRRAKMRAEKQREQRREMQNGGLVQVHKRTDRPNGGQTRRPTNRPTNRPNNRRR